MNKIEFPSDLFCSRLVELAAFLLKYFQSNKIHLYPAVFSVWLFVFLHSAN